MTRPPKQILSGIDGLLDQALDLAEPQRSAWLADLRLRQPALAVELQALLAGEAELEASGFLGDEAGADLAHAVGGLPEPDAALAGRRVGAYTLERPLGQGGMGTVWLGRRSDGRFEGQVAIKLLGLSLLDPVGSERFRREGSALARLAHPNISRLIDAGIAEGGQPYLVLEHVDGVRIDRWCDERRLAPADRLVLFQQVLAAVAHAHASLIVHRDLKPSNILVTPGGTVKLLDFGIAKLLEADEAAAERTELTVAGGLPFTPEYASPEQVTGGAITTATDVYALGVLLYLLLAGRHPTFTGRGSAEHLRAVVDTEPPRLSSAVSAADATDSRVAGARASTGERLRRLYLGDLDNILAKALRKAPAERYQSVAALGDDLRRYLRQEPVSARPQSLAYRARKFLVRNRVAVSAAAAAGAALLGATGFALVQMREARRQRDAAVYESRRADAQAEFQSFLISQAGDRPMTMREIVDRGRGALERTYPNDPRFHSAMLLQLSRPYADLGDGKQRLALLQRAESLAAAAGADGQVAEIRCELADHHRTQGSYDEAWKVLDQADAIRARGADPAVDETCLAARARLAVEQDRPEEAGLAIRQALASRERRRQTGDRMYFELLAGLGEALQTQGREREAIAVMQRAIVGLDSLGLGETLNRGVFEHNLALVLAGLGETREAERRLHAVVERVARNDPSGYIHPQPLIHYAETALAQDHADSAAAYFARLLAQAERDSSRYWQGRAAFGLARAQARLGQVAAARRTAAAFRRARTGFDRLLATDDVLPDTLALEGWIALAAADTATAHARFMGSLGESRFFEGKRRKQQRLVALRAAETALALGRVDTALMLARAAAEIASLDSLTGSRSAMVGDARLVEGRARLAAGDTAGALRAAQSAAAALRYGAGSDHPRAREAEAFLSAMAVRAPGAIPTASP